MEFCTIPPKNKDEIIIMAKIVTSKQNILGIIRIEYLLLLRLFINGICFYFTIVRTYFYFTYIMGVEVLTGLC